jgi:anthranilate phosphoribosyltransferase
VDVDELLTIVDPYDGYLRGVPIAPFLPPVLAAAGLRVLTHGVDSMGPKFGASHEAVLRVAGHTPAAGMSEAVRSLENDACGWAYISQHRLAPELAALTTLRTRIVKRPCLTTIEVAVNGLLPRKAHHLVTGFVHKPYPPIYARLAARAGFSSSILIRGVEGGVVPSLCQASRYFSSTDGVNLHQVDLEPAQLGIAQAERAVPLPGQLHEDALRSVKAPGNVFAQELATCAAETGLAALAGQDGPARDSLVYAGAVMLHALGKAKTLADAAARIRAVLDDGSAAQHFKAGWHT